MKVQFYLRFHTEFGQSLSVSGNTDELGDDDFSAALTMEYLNEQFWTVAIELKQKKINQLQYKYILKTGDREIIPEFGNDRTANLAKNGTNELQFIDTWNHAGEYENVFFTAPFQKTFLRENVTKTKAKSEKNGTHIFKVKAPLLQKNEVLCLSGAGNALNNWSTEKVSVLSKEGNWWIIKLNLSEENFPLAYKYGIYNVKEKKFLRYEDGNNRLLYGEPAKKKITIVHDGFAHFPNNIWKGAGVAIPVFSLRSKNNFGVGEFVDLKLLVDWAKATGLKMIQILPVNDTIATHSWTDSYPYAAISAFALHPLYINLDKVAGKEHADKLRTLKRKQKQLNELAEVDYEEVIKFKLGMLKELYELLRKQCFSSEGYQSFFEENKHWLVPYAVFCYFRDKYGDSHFEQWKTNGVYDPRDVEKLSAPGSKTFNEIALHYFIQYHLHLQLKEAADYAHKKGVVLKGDIPIGIYRYGCDAWVEPELYSMCMQAGAPPDDFAVKGQNWGFPTYNWKRMQEDGFTWWRRRFEQMSNYFDAFRIDHILGFFRIWSIPMHAIEGIMGYFVPAIPVNLTEFGEKGIWFDYYRYCKPYINDEIINQIFGAYAERIKREFVVPNEFGGYELEMGTATQRQVQDYFASLDDTEENRSIKQGLFDLISNVILFEEENSDGEKFHFRFGMENTFSFKYLDWQTQQKLKDLYIDYFYRRQDDFWKKEAMHKLPYLKRATNMLICGEDLGMVPNCVPDVMKQLGILSLEIQRMPKQTSKEFFHPNDAPYLSVVTPSTHDMSTIRGWWEEDRSRTQRFYNNILGQPGEAPYFCEAWVNRAVVLQHLYCPAMWSIFQLQDILGMNEKIRRENPNEERINVPANPKHYWRYRMHLTLEELLKQKEFNEELKGYVVHSSR
ncbi:MAG TPA: 4-alpha-glucanotransferase [Chitinophagaceae bacterium]|jgi:4-alpha-glucanotransferase|nr:4-alpha-glucanotransferase [Chitinophagaceae bacterium]